MKSRVLSTILFILFIQCGEPTDQGSGVEYDYTILNSSEQKLTLFLYKNNNRDLSSKVILEPGDKLQRKYLDGAPYDGFDMSQIFTSTESGIVTGIEVIFNNTKKIIYHNCSPMACPTGQKNIFSYDYNDSTIEVFEITTDDYQNAITCTGNCY